MSGTPQRKRSSARHSVGENADTQWRSSGRLTSHAPEWAPDCSRFSVDKRHETSLSSQEDDTPSSASDQAFWLAQASIWG